jgi:U3 small nucleolar ribonucleoprotein protein IMP3
MRDLKFHEKKLLRKVNQYDWKRENNVREISVLRKYHVSDRDDYGRYNKICGMITGMVAKI